MRSLTPLHFILIANLITGSLSASTDWIQFEGRDAHPTRILAELAVGGDQIQAQSDIGTLAASWGMEARQPFKHSPELVVFDYAPASSSPRGIKALREPMDSSTLKERIAALQATGLYAFVEPDYRMTIGRVPSDQGLSNGELWGLRNTGQAGGVAGVDVSALEAWDITTGSREVVVGVIDTGVRYTHQDLAGQMWRNPGESGQGRENNGRDDDNDGYVDNVYGINAINGSGDPWDDNDHGTHCAGTIGAAANGGGPHVGVAWDVQIMALKFLDASGSGSSSDAIACIDFAVGKGAQILSNSWGGGGSSNAMRRAIRNARDAGVLFVAAAGNDGSNNDRYPQYPANYDVENVVSVAAIDRRGNLANFSNYGSETVHVAAPGVSIYSTTSGSDRSYDSFSGTSMATPHVAGVAALILSHYPDIGIAELRDRLIYGSDPLGDLSGNVMANGTVNAHQSLILAEDGELEITLGNLEPSPLRGGSTVTFTARVSDLSVVRGANVTGNTTAGDFLTFVDSGFGADQTADDGIYSASTTLPTGVSSLTLAVSASALGKTGRTVERTFDITVPPPNDDYLDRISLVSGDRVTVDTDGASKQEREPNHAGNPGGKSVWWEFTAPTTGRVRVSTAGSNFDTTMGVYIGPALWLLAELDSDDDSGPEFTSEVEFLAIGGDTYVIAVDGYGGSSGTVQLALDFNALDTPNNDGFSGRSTLEGDSITIQANNRDAGRESGEPTHGGNPGGASLWWTWTPTTAGTVTVNTNGSSLDTTLGIYTGENLGSLTTVATDDDSGTGYASLIETNVIAGTAYHIAVDGYNGAEGDISLSLSHTPDPNATPPADPPPSSGPMTNDALGSAAELPRAGLTWRTTASNTGATKEADEPAHAGNEGGASVWWIWTAPTATRVTVSTAGSDFDTLLGVYRSFGGGMNGLLTVAYNDDHAGLTSEVSFNAAAGETYFIAVDGFAGRTGSIALELAINSGAFASNDAFVHRAPLVGTDLQVTGTNEFANREAGEPWHAGYSQGASVWWTWTAQHSGRVTLTTLGSDFDTLLAVYRGNTLSTLNEVAVNDDGAHPDAGLTSEVVFTAEAGVSYQIAVDGYAGRTGAIVLNLDQGSAANPTRSRLTNFSVRAVGGSTDQSLILGFSSRGSSSRTLLMRAIGPTLGDFGVEGALADPAVELIKEVRGQNLTLDRNDDWGGSRDMSQAFQSVGAFPLATGSADAGLMHDISSEAHTLVISGDGDPGVVLSEVYEVNNTDPDTEFSNISVRNFVGQGDEVLILGFVISGNTERELLIRGIGPTLETYGVADVLADPRVRVMNENGDTVATNDNWGGAASGLSSIFSQVGAFDLFADSDDSATTVTLGPGVYSVIVDSLTAQTGNALVEVYLLP